MKISSIPTWKIEAILDDPYCRGIDGADYEPVKQELLDELHMRQNKIKQSEAPDKLVKTSFVMTSEEKNMLLAIAKHRGCSMNQVLNDLAIKSLNRPIEAKTQEPTACIRMNARFSESTSKELNQLSAKTGKSMKEILFETLEWEIG